MERKLDLQNLKSLLDELKKEIESIESNSAPPQGLTCNNKLTLFYEFYCARPLGHEGSHSTANLCNEYGMAYTIKWGAEIK